MKIVLSPKQKHDFWTVRVGFGGPQNRPKSKKVSFGPFDNHSFDKNIKNHEFQKTLRTSEPSKMMLSLS